jgi:hypothetical protein
VRALRRRSRKRAARLDKSNARESSARLRRGVTMRTVRSGSSCAVPARITERDGSGESVASKESRRPRLAKLARERPQRRGRTGADVGELVRAPHRRSLQRAARLDESNARDRARGCAAGALSPTKSRRKRDAPFSPRALREACAGARGTGEARGRRGARSRSTPTQPQARRATS